MEMGDLEHGTRKRLASALEFIVAGRRLAAIAVMLFVFALGILPGLDSQATAAERRTVCAQDVWVRETPGGHAIAVLYRGESFDKTSSTSNGVWSYGFAYGGENVWGWLLTSALC